MEQSRVQDGVGVRSLPSTPSRRAASPSACCGEASAPITNAEIAARLEEAAELSLLCGQNPCEARAYASLARTLQVSAPSVAELVASGDGLAGIPGAGELMREHLGELLRRGTFERLEELRVRARPGRRELLAIDGLGPKRVDQLRAVLGISDIAGLARALDAGEVEALPGFGARSVARLRAALALRERARVRRWPRAEVEPIARALEDYLRQQRGVERVEVAGSFRRRRATVGDLDLLVCARCGEALTRRMAEYPAVQQVLARGRTRASVRLNSGLQVDMRVLPAESFGAALVNLTGSKSHNIGLRRRAHRMGLKVNEYGVWKGARRLAGRTEEDVYAALGLEWREPEQRG